MRVSSELHCDIRLCCTPAACPLACPELQSLGTVALRAQCAVSGQHRP
jgi:hypothetical protein